VARPRSSPAYDSFFEHTTLFEFSKVINSSTDLHFVLGHVLLTIMGKPLSTRGMALLGEGKAVFRVETVKGFPASLMGREVTLRGLPRSVCTIQSNGTRRAAWSRFFREQGVELILPLCVDNRPIGVLAFGPRLRKRKLQRKELTYLHALANLSATAILKAHSIEELRGVNRQLDHRVQELNTLFELSKEFSRLLDADKLVRLLVFSLLGQIGVSRYLICLRDGADLRVMASRIDGPAPQSELLKHLLRQKSAVTLSELPVMGKVDPRETLTRLGLQVLVPMEIQGETRGLILLGEKLSKASFTAGDLSFLSSLGNLAVIALENARLFREAIEKQKMEDDLLLAREIQKGLLPSVLPEVPGVELAAANVSSRQVGGDYYDVIALGGDRYVIAIGDVSGKGSPASLLMANLQATIRALVPLNLKLGELTGRVNDLMCENTGGDKFVTFFWGILDARTRSFVYVNAGHNPPYHQRANGLLHRLDRGGMILGVLKTSIPYEQGEIHFGDGDLLVLFTDGVSEAMNSAGVEYGEDRLERILAEAGAVPAQGVMLQIQEDVRRYAGSAAQSDDITLMVVRSVPMRQDHS